MSNQRQRRHEDKFPDKQVNYTLTAKSSSYMLLFAIAAHLRIMPYCIDIVSAYTNVPMKRRVIVP